MSERPVAFDRETATRLIGLLEGADQGGGLAGAVARAARARTVDSYFVRLVEATITDPVTAGSGVTVAVSSVVGIEVGSVLSFDTEDVTVSAVSGSDITATFAHDHADNDTFTIKTSGRYSGQRYRYSAIDDDFTAQELVWVSDANDAVLSPGAYYSAIRAGEWNGRATWVVDSSAGGAGGAITSLSASLGVAVTDEGAGLWSIAGIPYGDTGATTVGMLNNTTQTIDGAKTLTGRLTIHNTGGGGNSVRLFSGTGGGSDTVVDIDTNITPFDLAIVVTNAAEKSAAIGFNADSGTVFAEAAASGVAVESSWGVHDSYGLHTGAWATVAGLVFKGGLYISGEFAVSPGDLAQGGATTNDVLTWNGSAWAPAAPGSGSGTVTSVDVSGGTTGLSFTGGPITTSGTITASGTLNVANGGTGSGTEAGARANLLPTMTGNGGLFLRVNVGETDYELASPTITETVITTSTITGSVDDYAPTGWSTATVVRISATTPSGTITGFSSSGLPSGHSKRIVNVGSFPIYLDDQSTSSSASNRVVFLSGVRSDTPQLCLGQNASCTLTWDATTTRWRVSDYLPGDASTLYVGGVDAADGQVYCGTVALLDGLLAHRMFIWYVDTDSADRALNISLNGASRGLTFAGDATLSGVNTGDQFTSTTASRLIGRGSASGAGAAQEITLGTGLSMSGTTLNATASGVSDGDKGDITVSGSGATWTIDSGVVTFAKMQAVSANVLLGNDATGTTVEEITCTAAGRALLDDADAAAQRTTLGLGTLATQSGTFSGTSSGTNTGDQTITLTGDVTGSGTGSFAATIANNAVTFAKMQAVSANVLLGNDATGTTVEEITCTAAGRALLDDADAAAQRTTLGLVIGTNVQAYDAELAALAGLTSAADKVPYFTGAGTAATADFTTFGRSLVDDADAAAARTTLGLGSLATQSGTFSGTSSGTNTGDQFTSTTASRLIGRGSASGAGAAQEITLGTGLSMSGTTLNASATVDDGDKGDITVSSGVWTIDSGTITLAKMADMATASILGRNTAGTGAPEVLSASTTKTLLSLNNVENTAVSTWAGSTSITTLGTISTGTWSATAIGATKGGTAQTSWTTGDLLYASATDTLSKLAIGARTGMRLSVVSGAPAWAGDVIVLQNQQTSGTDGGTFTSGADRTEVINTEVLDDGGHCTLSSNQFTLAAGTYDIVAYTTGFACNNWQSWLYNVTDAATTLRGSSEYASATSPYVYTHSWIYGRFAISGSKAFEIRKRCSNTKSTNGFGVAASLGTEIYTTVVLVKVA